MNHTPEFTKPPESSAERAQSLAACYARVFLGSEDGKRVLANLRAAFGLSRLCFQETISGPYDPLAAAIRDGERRVMLEIESAIEKGAPGQALK